MRVQKDRYEIFLKVCETGSFSKAAEALNYTQSGISQMMAGLEEELGVQLFARINRGVTLTPEIELSSRQLLVTLAGIGLGVAGVTLEFVRKDLESGDIRLLKTDFTIPERSVDMCTLKEVPPTAAASAFMEMVQKDG